MSIRSEMKYIVVSVLGSTPNMYFFHSYILRSSSCNKKLIIFAAIKIFYFGIIFATIQQHVMDLSNGIGARGRSSALLAR